MKKFLLLAGALFLANVNGQVFQENWDGDGPGVAEWIIIDNDGNTPAEPVSDFLTAWVIKDRGGEIPNYGGPDGDFAAASTSWYDPAGQSDDWLISPEISIPTTGNISVKWDAKAQDPDYPDGYNLMVSPTAGTTSLISLKIYSALHRKTVNGQLEYLHWQITLDKPFV